MILLGDCLVHMKTLPSGSVDMVYLDPPFFTQKVHKLASRENQAYTFSDVWADINQYKEFVEERLSECRRLLRETGSIFLHCDRAASHHLRLLLDEIFGVDNFRNEIIWSYRRWSNAKTGLLNGHQTIFFYSRTSAFRFNLQYGEYSPTTNIDQILQKRERDETGKAVYKRTNDGDIEFGGAKKGVPLTDVWDLPFLNPKATERTGYPTQKPIHLMERLIRLTTDEGDVILDPFCGSGTTAVAAKLLNRGYIGIDVSEDAVELTRQRLAVPMKSESQLLMSGEAAYKNQAPEIERLLTLIDAVTVQRNNGIDGFLKQEFGGKPIPIRVQRDWEDLHEAKAAFKRACEGKGCLKRVLIVTNPRSNLLLDDFGSDEPDLILIDSLHLAISRALRVASDSGEVTAKQPLSREVAGSG
jgi:site-specific DNA-methyltransferase (adenine-specific)